MLHVGIDEAGPVTNLPTYCAHPPAFDCVGMTARNIAGRSDEGVIIGASDEGARLVYADGEAAWTSWVDLSLISTVVDPSRTRRALGACQSRARAR